MGSASDEFQLISSFLGGMDRGDAVRLGVGDDAAVLSLEPGEELVVSTDCAVTGVHFPDDADPELAAFRAVAAAASDLAAMGARPLAMTLTLAAPDSSDALFAGLQRGLRAASDSFSLPLVGGDLARAPLSFGVQVLGAVPRGEAIQRAGARTGDRVCVSGFLGDAAAGLAVLKGELTGLPGALRSELLERFWRPQPALVLGASLRGRASAMIDVSDGLLADAGHLARASGVCLRIDSSRVPRSPELCAAAPPERALDWALAGGEDYVLCFTLGGDQELPRGCTEIGVVEAGEGVKCDHSIDSRGYRHF